MNKSSLRYLTLGLIVSVASGRMALADGTSANLKVTLRAYNYAAVPGKTLIEAQAVVTRIFAKIGVKATWADSSMLRSEGTHDSSLAVIIVGRSAALFIPRSKTAMGSTPRGEGNTQGRVTYISYDRVEDFTRVFQARSVRTNNVDTLAYTIAHEIGHLLLPLEAHSPTGIMRCSWEVVDFTRMVTGELSFAPGWVELFKGAVLRRTAE